MLNPQVKDARPVSGYSASMQTMGDRIKLLREAKGLTQSELGKLCGVSKSAVSQWEDGSTANIKLSYFMRLIEVLGTDPKYLIWGGGSRGISRRIRRIRQTSQTKRFLRSCILAPSPKSTQITFSIRNRFTSRVS